MRPYGLSMVDAARRAHGELASGAVAGIEEPLPVSRFEACCEMAVFAPRTKIASADCQDERARLGRVLAGDERRPIVPDGLAAHCQRAGADPIAL